MNAVISPIAEGQSARPDELPSRLEAQQQAFLNELPVSLETRRDRIDRAISLLKKHQDGLCDAMDADFGGRPPLLSKLTDIAASVNALKDARKHVKRWTRKDRRSVRFPLNLLGARAWVEYQPKGVVGIISPWNYPVQLAFSPLGGIFAAGNRVMLKPSEHTPRTSQAMADAVAEYFDPSEFTVVTGGPDIGQAFSALPFDHLLFTGSTSIGRHIMRAAAENLTPVTLELGGKSPTIVGANANLEQAAERIVLGKMLNAGQTCLAPDYVLAPGDQVESLATAITSAAARIYPQIEGNAHYTQVVNERNFDRLKGYLDDARERGVELRETHASNDTDRRMPLVLAIDPADDATIMCEELFGPILPIKSYESIDEAIEYINARPRPLGLYYFGPDRAERRQVLDRTISGGVTLDDVIYHITDDDLPFGGVGESGIGAYHGEEGFRTFSHAKAIYRQSGLNLAKLAGLIPPYGKRLESMVKMDLK